MSDYVSNITLADAAALMRGARSVLVTTHAKPDGDAFGSVGAVVAALRHEKPPAAVTGLLMPPIPAAFESLRAYPLLRRFNDSKEDAAAARDAELVIVLDTGAWSQIEPMRALLGPKVDQMLIVDHHLVGGVPARHKFIDSDASSCCNVVAGLLDALSGAAAEPGRPTDPNPLMRDPVIAESLFTGLASDTGWFRFSNTNAAAHQLAARLIAAGVDHADLYARLEQTERPEKLALMIRALSSMKLLAQGQVAVMVLRASDFADTGAAPDETEKFVDIPQAVESVKVVVLVTQSPDGGQADKPPPVRLSFRSKPGDDAVNVATLAGRFGGGGPKVHAPIGEVIRGVEHAAVEAVRMPGGTP